MTELAGLIGRHRYQTRSQVVEKIWKRLQPDAYEAAKSAWTTSETALAPTQERIQEVIQEAGDQVQQLFQQVVEQAEKASSSSQVQSIVQEIEQVSTQELKNQNPGLASASDEHVDQIKKMIVSQTQCAFGTQQEERSIQQFSQDNNVRVQEGNTRFYKKWIGSTSMGTRWGFGGYVDGITEDAIVEIKNRIRRFFTFIPEYEQIQLQAYMQVLDMNKAIHIQQFNGEQRQETVDRDEELWDCEIQPALEESARLVERFCCLTLEEQGGWLSLDVNGKEAYLDALNRISL
ncbi:MAG: hypothetical protein K0U20_08475 [Proteobacteria bacterium]|nr:hypothetical protein [Pseudomonadota bacterium]